MDLTILSFDEFWEWLMGHPNCILRAGTPDTILFDDEDFYWHLARTGVEPRVVRGNTKRLRASGGRLRRRIAVGAFSNCCKTRMTRWQTRRGARRDWSRFRWRPHRTPCS